MNHYVKIIIIHVLLLSFVLTGCHQLSRKETGILYVIIDDDSLQRILLPGITLIPSTYMLTGDGPGDLSFGPTSIGTNTSTTIDDLSYGEWILTMEAFNRDGVLLATGTETVMINVSETTVTTITMEYITGSGQCEITVEYIIKDITTPELSGILRPSTGPDIDLVFSEETAIVEDKARFTATEATLPGGFYTLIIQLKDKGVSGTDDYLTMGLVDMVRIFPGQTSDGFYNLVGVPNKGNLEVHVDLNFTRVLPLSITNFYSLPIKLPADSTGSYTLTAGITAGDPDTGNLTYIWYLNGTSVGVGENFTLDLTNNPLGYTIDNTFIPGKYRLDVTAFNSDGTRGGSSTLSFEILKPGEVYEGTILYVRDNGTFYDACWVSPDGSEGDRIATDVTHLGFPDLSRDGTKITYYRGEFDNMNIWVAELETGKVESVTHKTGTLQYPEYKFPQFSPDGQHIVFQEVTLYKDVIIWSDISMMQSDGSNKLKLTDDFGAEGKPFFSPDGARIAYVDSYNSQSVIHIMNIDGTNIVPIPVVDLSGFCNIRWSPDGTKILAMGPNYTLHVINTDGTGSVQVTPNATMCNDYTWNKDGTRIVYSVLFPANDSWEIYRVDADGANFTRLTNDDENQKDACYSPWVDKIAYLYRVNNKNCIFVMNDNGTNITQLTSDYYDQMNLSWE